MYLCLARLGRWQLVLSSPVEHPERMAASALLLTEGEGVSAMP